MKKTILVAAVLMVLGAGAAQAQTTGEHTRTYDSIPSVFAPPTTPTPPPWGYDAVSNPAPGVNGIVWMYFPQFNPSLGTLFRVEITLTGEIEGAVQAVNHDTVNSQSGTAQEGGDIVLGDLTMEGYSDRPYIYMLLEVRPTSSVLAFNNLAKWDGAPGHPETQTVPFATDTADTGFLSDTSYLDAVTGTGYFRLPVLALGTVVIGGSSNITYEPSLIANAYGSVTYEYTPEPTTSAILLCGVVMLAAPAYRRRRNRRANAAR